MARSAAPDLTAERELMDRFGGPVIGMDEVGRGAIAGPVAVGAVWVDPASAGIPRAELEGVRDSKLLSPARREALYAGLKEGAVGAVGLAEASEVDEHGIICALRLAGMRALEQLPAAAAVLLDGSHDWLSTPGQEDLFAPPVAGPDVPVTVRTKADMTCWSVAAASILAKVERDRLMAELAQRLPGYGFERHKGYGTAEHTAALRERGLTGAHRRSWAIGGA